MDIQSRIQSQVEQFQKAVFKATMPIQKSAYLCMAKCTDITKTPEQIERCYKGCQKDIEIADNQVQSVINTFQKQLEKCNLDCQSKTSQDEYEKCMDNCASNILDTFPNETETLISKLQGQTM